MSENVSTQLPKPPELQPLPDRRPKPWQSLSYMLIIAGLVLLGWGGWLYYQNWLEASKPPPARILEVSAADLETPTLQPSPTKSGPTATPTRIAGATSAGLSSGSSTSDTVVISPTADATLDVTPGPLPSAALASDGGTSLSLEDYPLVVPEEAEAQATPAEPVSASSEPASVASAPLSRIVAESINLDSPVVGVGWKQVMQNSQLTNVWEVAEYAAGWHNNSWLPGQSGNIVLSGHHNIKGEVFRYIVDLEPGAAISLFMGDQRYDYAVVDKFIVKDKGEPEAVRRENAKWVGPFNDERVTLVTCWPYNNNTHRVIVIAKPLEAANSTLTINAVTASGD